MNHNLSKPKLLFFQYRHSRELPAFLVMHRLQQVKCLSEFFEVFVIQDDCDYRRVCDQYEPDLALFEMLSGAELLNTRRPEVANSRTCRDIPKLAFFNADAWCDARAGFLSDMEHMGIDTAFSICTTAAEHTPELADKLFVWPNFIDPDVYRDYGQAKVIPAFFTGAMSTLYPWRRKIEKIVADHYPALRSPHHGYLRHPRAGQMMYGETYARAINASWFVPTCGTVARDVIRKHFEIPGCRACLVTEQSAALESAGFVDMRNCVFADETTVLDKLAYLLEHEEELVGIIQAGYEFAHTHHTLRQRDQILQWFHLNRKLRAGEKIIQENPFGPLIITEGSSHRRNSPTGQGIHLTLLQQGDTALGAGNYSGAAALYRRSSNYIPWMPEPTLRLALSNLYLGYANDAYTQIVKLVRYITVQYKAADPDPVEWAYLIVSLLCLGKLDEASQRAGQFPALRHPELDHARWAIEALTAGGMPPPLPDDGAYRCSIHRMQQRTLEEWIEQLCMMLRACKQPEFSAKLMDLPSLRQAGGGLVAPRIDAAPHRSRRFRKYSPIEFLPASPKSSSLRQRVRTRLRRWVGNLMHHLERRYGYFLPYHISEMRNDEFLRLVRTLAREKPFKTALLMGAAKGDGITEAFLSGVMENENKPAVFCISNLESEVSCLENTFADHRRVNCYGIAICSEDELVGQLQTTATQIKKEHLLNGFEVLVIDGSKFKQLTPGSQLAKELHNATHILLSNVSDLYNHVNYHQLVGDPDFVTVDCNPEWRNGYAIFEKIEARRRRTNSARADS